jgi:hypothetical protein
MMSVPVLKIRKLPVPYVFFDSPWSNAARDGYLAQEAGGLDGAVDLGRALDLGEHRARDVEGRQDLVVPLERLEVHEEGARRVGDVRDVDAAVGAAREVPEDPGVGRAEHELAGLGLGAGALDVLEDPDDLRAREVGGEGKPDGGLEPLDAAVGCEAVDDLLGARVLPDDGVVDGLAGGAVPHHGGLALVGDAHGLDVVARDVGLGQRLPDDLARVAPDLHRVVLDPAGAGEDLLVLELAGGDDGSGVVEDDGARAGGALVDGDDVLLAHVVSPCGVEGF